MTPMSDHIAIQSRASKVRKDRRRRQRQRQRQRRMRWRNQPTDLLSTTRPAPPQVNLPEASHGQQLEKFEHISRLEYLDGVKIPSPLLYHGQSRDNLVGLDHQDPKVFDREDDWTLPNCILETSVVENKGIEQEKADNVSDINAVRSAPGHSVALDFDNGHITSTTTTVETLRKPEFSMLSIPDIYRPPGWYTRQHHAQLKLTNIHAIPKYSDMAGLVFATSPAQLNCNNNRLVLQGQEVCKKPLNAHSTNSVVELYPSFETSWNSFGQYTQPDRWYPKRLHPCTDQKSSIPVFLLQNASEDKSNFSHSTQDIVDIAGCPTSACMTLVPAKVYQDWLMDWQTYPIRGLSIPDQDDAENIKIANAIKWLEGLGLTTKHENECIYATYSPEERKEEEKDEQVLYDIWANDEGYVIMMSGKCSRNEYEVLDVEVTDDDDEDEWTDCVWDWDWDSDVEPEPEPENEHEHEIETEVENDRLGLYSTSWDR